MMLIYEVYIKISLCLTLKLEISLLLGRERSELEISYFQMFRAEKRNKHGRVLAVHQVPSLKKWREFRGSRKQKELRV